MNNPQMTFKNVQQLIELGYGTNLPNNKNNMPNWLTTLINLTVIATMIVGTIYIFNLI
jgi:hypothetical protein